LLRVGATVHVGYSGDSIYDDLLALHGPVRLTVERTNWLDANLSGDARLNLGTVLRRRRWLKAVGADTLFVVQQAGGLAFINCLIAAKSFGLRVTTSIRQSPQPIPRANEKRWFGLIPAVGLWRRRLLWRARLPARCADAVIFNSHRVADAFARQYVLPRDRFHIIRNGEPATETAGLRHFHDYSAKIASVGRVTSAKGADTLLEAFSTIVQRIQNVQLTYFGDGPLVPELKRRARDLGLADRVHFAGYQSDRDQLFRDVDVCVQPSRRESMSNSVIEAMARGIPCVVSNVGGMPEAIVDGESGFVVPPGEPAACAKAITRLLSNREKLHQFSAAAARRARSLFDLHEFQRATVAAILGV
jgi:glycosyltransferase involved in cell wall biosynthesis